MSREIAGILLYVIGVLVGMATEKELLINKKNRKRNKKANNPCYDCEADLKDCKYCDYYNKENEK